MNNKIKSSTKINTIFLAISLVAGTIAGISPSSFIIGVEAQTETEYGYNNSYEPTKYSDYNNYQKLKDSVSIEKIKCNNININFIGNNTGDINLGNNSRVIPTTAAGAEGDLSPSSFGGGYGDETNYGYDEGYDNNPDIGFECIINNNNTNTNFGDGNETEPQTTCETCFSILNVTVRESLLMNIDAILTSLDLPHEELITIGDLCEFLETSTYQDKRALLNTALNSESVPAADINSILSCLEDLGIIEVV